RRGGCVAYRARVSVSTGRTSRLRSTRQEGSQMRRAYGVAIAALVLAIVPAAAQQRGGGGRAGGPATPPMTLTVSGFADGGQIPVRFSQAAEGAAPGEGTSPALSWTNVPPGTQSFVLHMHDMDVARNRTTDDQVHWLV